MCGPLLHPQKTRAHGAGVSNLVFFPDAQERIRSGLFRTAYLFVRGRTRRSGARGISVTGEMAWGVLDLSP